MRAIIIASTLLLAACGGDAWVQSVPGIACERIIRPTFWRPNAAANTSMRVTVIGCEEPAEAQP